LGRDEGAPDSREDPGRKTMEQNRSFIIILSVTFILIAFFGIGLWLFYPKTETSQQLASSDSLIQYFNDAGSEPQEQPSNSVDLSQENREEKPDSAASVEPALVTKGGEFEIVYGLRPGASTTRNPGSSSTEESAEQAARPSEAGQSLEGNLGRTEGGTASTTQVSQNNVTRTPEQRTPAKELGGTTSPASRAATAETSESTPKPATVSRTQTSPASQVRAQEYWIQVISSPSRERVEQVHTDLKSHGLGGRITSKLIENTTYYRLRYGPYTEKAEADKFLEWITTIPQFKESYVSLEYRE
jgi:cell division septation protein DedD